METWEIPPPPDVEVRKVVDASGREFERTAESGEYWLSTELGPGRGVYAWHELLYQRGRVTAA